MPVFQQFGPSHLTALLLMLAAGAVLVANAKRLRSAGDDRLVRRILAAVLVGNEVGSWGVAVVQGRWGLPCQLCDLAVFLMAWALLGRRRLVGEIAVLWGLAGSVQAVLTPDLSEGFPSYAWVQFFLGHCAVVLSAVYLVARGRVHLTSASVWRVWLVSNVYVVIAGLLNWQLGTNFGYLARKPAHPSLLDALGRWPWYIVGVEGIALALFFCCVGFARLVDRWARA
ncbi:MAG: TIGR02206 family membrane protein [Candidatus Omnitrophica bacterium]|nr:TIGR02206 family membrane protein [Candidatus Omnitrophota bacterium]